MLWKYLLYIGILPQINKTKAKSGTLYTNRRKQGAFSVSGIENMLQNQKCPLTWYLEQFSCSVFCLILEIKQLKASAHYNKQTNQWGTVNLFIWEHIETVNNMLKSHPVTLASEFIIWLSHYFFPYSCCSVKRAGSQDLPKFRMGPCHTPHRSTMCLQDNTRQKHTYCISPSDHTFSWLSAEAEVNSRK